MIDSHLYSDWYQSVCVPPYNDYLIAISASSKTPVSGTGKTTQGAGLATALDRSADGFDAETQATLNAEEFANTVIPDAPNRGSVLIDETQGTPGEGSGINRMRAMSSSTMEAIGSVMANRDKNLTIIVVVQRLGMLFSDLFPMIDAWLLITKAPGQPNGPKAKHHKVFQEDYPDAGGGLKTPAVETVSWPAIPEDDPNYTILEEKKQVAKVKGGGEQEDKVRSEAEEIQLVRWFKSLTKQDEDRYTVRGCPWEDIPEDIKKGHQWYDDFPQVDGLSYSGQTYRRRINKNSASTEAAAGD